MAPNGGDLVGDAMAKLFDEIFTGNGSGDIDLIVSENMPDLNSETMRLRCHSLVLTQHPYFYKMLSMDSPLLEGVTREVRICEPCADFVELIHFIYTNQTDINRGNVAGLLTLADKYCIDEVVDLCLKFLKDNFDADAFFNFYNFTTLNSAYQEKLKEQLMSAIRHRRNLCFITEDERWRELPIDFAEEILAQDDLPIASEAEVLTLIVQWLGTQRRDRRDVARLLGAFRKSSNMWIRVSDVANLMEAWGVDVLSGKEPRTGSAVWDPSFMLHRHESAGQVLGQGANENHANNGGASENAELCYQLGPKDFLQQEPGWMHPGTHQCRVTLTCNSWSHRERRLLRPGRTPIEAAAGLQRRVIECSPSMAGTHERSPSPPPTFRARMPPIESFETFYDGAQLPDGSEPGFLAGGMRSHLQSVDKIDHELVDHQIVCGVLSGYQRHGVKFSQRERNAIYFAEDLNGKHGVSIGGTTSSVGFDLQLTIGAAENTGISRCRFAVMRKKHVLLEEVFDVSAKVPLRFYFSSHYFDKNSAFDVSVRWLRPLETPSGRLLAPLSPGSVGPPNNFMR